MARPTQIRLAVISQQGGLHNPPSPLQNITFAVRNRGATVFNLMGTIMNCDFPLFCSDGAVSSSRSRPFCSGCAAKNWSFAAFYSILSALKRSCRGFSCCGPAGFSSGHAGAGMVLVLWHHRQMQAIEYQLPFSEIYIRFLSPALPGRCSLGVS